MRDYLSRNTSLTYAKFVELARAKELLEEYFKVELDISLSLLKEIQSSVLISGDFYRSYEHMFPNCMPLKSLTTDKYSLEFSENNSNSNVIEVCFNNTEWKSISKYEYVPT